MYLEEDAVKGNKSSTKGSGEDVASKSMYSSQKPAVFESFFLLQIHIHTNKVKLIINYSMIPSKLNCIYKITNKAAMLQTFEKNISREEHYSGCITCGFFFNLIWK